MSAGCVAGRRDRLALAFLETADLIHYPVRLFDLVVELGNLLGERRCGIVALLDLVDQTLEGFLLFPTDRDEVVVLVREFIRRLEPVEVVL